MTAPRKNGPFDCLPEFWRKDRTTMVYRLEKYDLKIMFTHLDQNNPGVVVTLGSEARTFQFEDFIDFWLEMTELVPKAVYVHIAYRELLARQRRERFRGTRLSRKSVSE